MTKNELIQYLRTTLSIEAKEDNGGEEVTTFDETTSYLRLSDEELEKVLIVSLSRNYPEMKSLNNVPNSVVYPLILLAKKELFTSLAVKYAPWYNLSAEGGNSLSREQVFNHFMQLAEQAEKEYQQYLEDGAENNTLVSYDVLLANRWYTKRNYERGTIPAPSLYIDRVGGDVVECSWQVQVNHFDKYVVYISLEPILDLYSLDKKINEDIVLASTTIKDYKHTMCRFSGLDSSTTYYITLACYDLTKLVGYAVESVSTLAE